MMKIIHVVSGRRKVMTNLNYIHALIVICGKNLPSENQNVITLRLYKHSEGEPAEVLPILVKATNKANQIVTEIKNTISDADLHPDVLATAFIGEATAYEWQGAALEFQKAGHVKTEPTYLGNQKDIEWVYIVDTDNRSIVIYAGIKELSDLFLTDPAILYFKVREWSVDAEVARSNFYFSEDEIKAEKELQDLNWNINLS
jgi:hypothetical protein